MRINFTSTDGSAVLRLAFDPAADPDSAGVVTVPAARGSLTIDGADHTGISGSCSLSANPNADAANASASHTGTFALAIAPDTATALSGTIAGSFDSEGLFRPHSLTDVILAASLGASDVSLTLLPPPAEDGVAMGTASVIIKPT